MIERTVEKSDKVVVVVFLILVMPISKNFRWSIEVVIELVFRILSS